MPSNSPIAPIEEKKFEEALLDVNVSQQPHEEKSFKNVVRIRINELAWDHRLSPNPHALIIYLKFVLVRGVTPEKFDECQCEYDDVHLH